MDGVQWALWGPHNKLKKSLRECRVLPGEPCRSSCLCESRPAASPSDNCSDTSFTAAAARAKNCNAFADQINRSSPPPPPHPQHAAAAAQRPTNRFLFWLSRRIILAPGRRVGGPGRGEGGDAGSIVVSWRSHCGQVAAVPASASPASN